MSFFRKKPVIIEAHQWNGTLAGMKEIQERFPSMATSSSTTHPRNGTVQEWSIATLEGQHRVSPEDWIIKGVKGEFYPCKPDIFEATYEYAD
jgi:hypothetical protein